MSAAAVLFDIDGTLVDSTYHHAIAWHRAFTRITDVPPMWRLHRAIGMGGDRLVAAVAGDRTEERHGDDLRDAWRSEYAKLRAEVRAIDGATALVQKLVADGFVVALASSGDPEFSQEAVDLLGIGDDIAALLTSDDVDSSKPDPDLIEQTLERIGAPDAAVFVGDTVYDVESAARAGIGCLTVRTGGFGKAELETAGALQVADALPDLRDIDWRRLLES